jgi:hypothetical protein
VRQGFDYKISAILQNITKKKKIIMVSFLLVAPPEARSETALLSQTAVLDEPNTPNRDDVPTMPNEDDDVSEDSEDSDVEILDDGSDTDIYEESELMKFSRMLCDAQKRALAEEKAKGIKRKTYDGNLRATVYHRKRYRSDLAAQGYLPVPEFMKLIDARKEKDKLTELAVEESEASSDDDAVTVSWCRSNEPSMSKGTDFELMQGPAAHEDRRQLAQEPAPSEDRRQLVQQGPVAREDHPHLQVVQGPVASETCRQAVHHLAEEEEESTESEGEDVGSEKNTHLGATLFDDLWRCILMDSAESSCVSSDGTSVLQVLCDRPKLHTAHGELAAKMDDKGLDLVTRRRIQGMLGLLNLYLDEGLDLTWKKASVPVSKAQGPGDTHA